MDSNQIVQLIGLIYFVFGLWFLFNKKYYINTVNEYTNSHSLLLLSWIIAFILGFVIVVNYNVWTFSKEWFITLIWWIWLIKWISLVIFPRFTMKFSDKVFGKNNFFTVTFFILLAWLVLLYLGYMA